MRKLERVLAALLAEHPLTVDSPTVIGRFLDRNRRRTRLRKRVVEWRCFLSGGHVYEYQRPVGDFFEYVCLRCRRDIQIR